MASTKHVGHSRDDIAHHIPWGFRSETFIWEGARPVCLNFHPVATELHEWLLGKGSPAIYIEQDREQPNSYTNPYTYYCTALAAIITDVVNDSYVIATSKDAVKALNTEVQRVRIFSEMILYVTRICESLIKQLLYCTQISEKYYKNANLGRLLSTECRACRDSSKPRHKLSLLGSLAHRYHICHAFDGCLIEHLKIVGRRRNLEAAHSDVTNLNVTSAAESRAKLMKDSIDLVSEFKHMLSHIKDLETKMAEELHLAVRLNCIEKLSGTELVTTDEYK